MSGSKRYSARLAANSASCLRVSAKSAIRIMAFGDYGDGGADQRRVAKAMLKYQRQKPVDFGITLGDNFQDQGADSPEDARWIPRWRDLYPALKIRFYPHARQS